MEKQYQDIDIKHFERGVIDNPRFWSRFDPMPDLKGKSVLDLGSGWGSLCVDMANRGAKKVVGIDIKPELVEFSKRYVKEFYPHLVKVIHFECQELRNFKQNTTFDIIVSKDSFEHIHDLPGMLEEMKKRLKPGGKIYSGFGPLYPSPYGDHGRRRSILRPLGLIGKVVALIPWGHLAFEPLLIGMNNKYRNPKISSIKQLQLNTLGFSDYIDIFQKSGFSTVYIRKNNSTSIASRLLSQLAKISFFEDYCVHNLYCVLEKSLQ